MVQVELAEEAGAGRLQVGKVEWEFVDIVVGKVIEVGEVIAGYAVGYEVGIIRPNGWAIG